MFVGIYEVVRSGEKRSLIVVVSPIKEKDQQSGQEETCEVDIVGKSGNGNASFPPILSFSLPQPILAGILSGLDIEIKRNPTFSISKLFRFVLYIAAFGLPPQKMSRLESRREISFRASDVQHPKAIAFHRRRRCAFVFIIPQCGGIRDAREICGSCPQKYEIHRVKIWTAGFLFTRAGTASHKCRTCPNRIP